MVDEGMPRERESYERIRDMMGFRKIKTRQIAAVVVINEHMNQHEQNGGKESECEKCRGVYRSRNELLKHLRVVNYYERNGNDADCKAEMRMRMRLRLMKYELK